jgi:peptidyl-tRNA hydrolase
MQRDEEMKEWRQHWEQATKERAAAQHETQDALLEMQQRLESVRLQVCVKQKNQINIKKCSSASGPCTFKNAF